MKISLITKIIFFGTLFSWVPACKNNGDNDSSDDTTKIVGGVLGGVAGVAVVGYGIKRTSAWQRVKSWWSRRQQKVAHVSGLNKSSVSTLNNQDGQKISNLTDQRDHVRTSSLLLSPNAVRKGEPSSAASSSALPQLENGVSQDKNPNRFTEGTIEGKNQLRGVIKKSEYEYEYELHPDGAAKRKVTVIKATQQDGAQCGINAIKNALAFANLSQKEAQEAVISQEGVGFVAFLANKLRERRRSDDNYGDLGANYLSSEELCDLLSEGGVQDAAKKWLKTNDLKIPLVVDIQQQYIALKDHEGAFFFQADGLAEALKKDVQQGKGIAVIAFNDHILAMAANPEGNITVINSSSDATTGEPTQINTQKVGNLAELLVAAVGKNPSSEGKKPESVQESV